MLTNCPLGWGHEPRLAHAILDAAVESCFWPLYEVVDGRYRLTYEPEEVLPVEEWLRPQTRFAHLLRPENADARGRDPATRGRRVADATQPMPGRSASMNGPSRQTT